MILLVGAGHDTLGNHEHDHLGRLIQPRDFGNIADTADAGIPWAADNDAFQGWNDEREQRYLKMLDAITGVKPGPLFVTAPDVVGDALATARLFAKWEWQLRKRGLPIALVAQDGIEKFDPVPGRYPTEEAEHEAWAGFDALFIGGSTEFKLSEYVADLVTEAKRQGKWVHMGRVNTAKRIRYAGSIGCDSFDGTKYSRWRKTYLDVGLAMAGAGRQERLKTTTEGTE